MIYTLMMKNYSVLDFEVHKDVITVIPKIYNEQRIPLNLINNLTIENLSKWIKRRCIPEGRRNYKILMKNFNKNIWNALETTHALNLSDTYWIKREDECLDWNEINFYTNVFSYDMGNILLDHTPKFNELNLNSPDFCTCGNNPKAWRIKNGERYLIKGNLQSLQQEGVNEHIISKFIESQDLKHLTCIESRMTRINDVICSRNKCFTTDTIEMIPAYCIAEYLPRPDGVYVYDHFIKMCELLKIPDMKPFLDAMLAIDYITNQKDRHLGNFCVLRNADTLEFIGPGPLYDNGNSLWFDEELYNTNPGILEDMCKPFGNFHSEQIKYINDKDILESIDIEMLKSIIYNSMRSVEIEPKRIKIIMQKVDDRYHTLEHQLEKIHCKNKEKDNELTLI